MEGEDNTIQTSPQEAVVDTNGLFSKIKAISPIGEKATVKDWEAIFLAIDRQIISFGLRIILFLPAFAIFTYFIAWAFPTVHQNGG